jgi:glycosyltransferase involved in cell wall biosynthesis
MMKKNKDVSLLILYEMKHIDMVLAHFGTENLTKGGDFVIVPADYEIEVELKSRGIPHQSLKEYRPKSSLRDRIELSGRLMRHWHESPELSFFKYKGISVGAIVEYSLSEYLLRVLYYLDIFSYILDHSQNVHVVYVPESTVLLSPTVGQLAQFEIVAPRDILMLLGHVHNIEVQTIPLASRILAPRKARTVTRQLVRIGMMSAFRLYNGVISIFRRRDAMKIFVSDYWWHINSFVATMRNVEVTMMERKEIQNAKPFLWSHRMRFNQAGDYITSAMRENAEGVRVGYETAWSALNDEMSFKKEFVYGGVSFWEIVKPAYDHLVTSFSRKVVESIDGTERLFQKQNIHAVILRASVSGQIHFSVLALVARKMGIPAIELQHGLEYMDPISHSVRKSASVLASYGPLIERDLARANGSALKIVNIGSPRFDQYLNKVILEEKQEALRKKLGIDARHPVILFVAPDIVIGQTFDTYDVVRTFETLSALRAVKDLQIIVKIRPGPERENFFKKVLRDTLGEKYILAQYENMQELFSISNAVISCFSTVALEAMIAQKPVILDGTNANDLMIIESHFLPYEKANAVRIARTGEELVLHASTLIVSKEAQKLTSSAKEFLRKNYCFDGKASERMKDFLETLRG